MDPIFISFQTIASFIPAQAMIRKGPPLVSVVGLLAYKFPAMGRWQFFFSFCFTGDNIFPESGCDRDKQLNQRKS